MQFDTNQNIYYLFSVKNITHLKSLSTHGRMAVLFKIIVGKLFFSINTNNIYYILLQDSILTQLLIYFNHFGMVTGTV